MPAAARSSCGGRRAQAACGRAGGGSGRLFADFTERKSAPPLLRLNARGAGLLRNTGNTVIIADRPPHLPCPQHRDPALTRGLAGVISMRSPVVPRSVTESADQSRYASGSERYRRHYTMPAGSRQYASFIERAARSEKTSSRWERDTPISMAVCRSCRGNAARTLRFGPMKPVGLTNPHNPRARP